VIRRRAIAVYRVIDEEELLSGPLLPADGVDLPPDWAARLAPPSRAAWLPSARRLVPLTAAVALASAALALIAASWAPRAATGRAPVAPHASTPTRQTERAARAAGEGRAAHAAREVRIGQPIRSGAAAVTRLPASDRPSAIAAARHRVARAVERGLAQSPTGSAGRRSRANRRGRRSARLRRARRLAAVPGAPPPAGSSPARAVPASAVVYVTAHAASAPSASPATEFGFER